MFFMEPMLLADDSDATVIVSTDFGPGVGTASPILNTLSAAVNDIAIVLCNGTPNSDGAGTWAALSNASPSIGSLYWKVLNSTDIAGTIRAGATNVRALLMVVRGAVSLTSVRTDTSTAGATATGITRNINHAGLIGVVTQRNGSGENITGFVASTAEAQLTTYAAKLFYRTSPPTTAYAGGTGFIYDNGGGSASTNMYLLIAELRR